MQRRSYTGLILTMTVRELGLPPGHALNKRSMVEVGPLWRENIEAGITFSIIQNLVGIVRPMNIYLQAGTDQSICVQGCRY